MAVQGGGSTSGLASAASNYLQSTGAAPANHTIRNFQYLGVDQNGQSIYKVTFIVGSRGRQQVRSAVLGFRQTTLGQKTGAGFGPPKPSGVRWFVGPPKGSIGSRAKKIPISSDFELRGRDPILVKQIDAALKRLGEGVQMGAISEADAAQLSNFINNWQGTAGALASWTGKMFARFQAPRIQIGEGIEQPFEPFFDLGSGGGGFGGGGGGPQYMAPDRRVVEDFVRGNLVGLIGAAPNTYVQNFTDLYMRDHRRDFDSLDRQIDPAQSVTEAIRKTNEYQVIHKLRPQGTDEREWIGSRRALAARAGLAEARLDDFAITQATVGTSQEDIPEAAAGQEFAATGRAPSILRNEFAQVAQAMMSRVR